MPRRDAECLCCGCKSLYDEQWYTTTEGDSFIGELRGTPAHIFNLDISRTTRAEGDASGSDFRIDPFEVDFLYGCDADGNNPLLKLKARMEHGEILDLDQSVLFYGSWSIAPLKSHVMSVHKDSPTSGLILSSAIQLVECNVFLDLFDEDGSELSSILLPQIPSGEFIGLTLSIGIAEDGDTIAPSVRYTGGMLHIFDSYTPNDPLWRSRTHCKVSVEKAKRLSVNFSHSAMNKSKKTRTFERPIESSGDFNAEDVTVNLSPLTPADTAPFCDIANAEYQNTRMIQSWPWYLQDNCEFWTRTGRVSSRRASFDPITLAITVSGADYPLADAIKGAFDLGSTSLGSQIADNVFCGRRSTSVDATEGPGYEWSRDTFECVTEWSATISFNEAEALGSSFSIDRCRSDWATLMLFGRATYQAGSGDDFTLFFYNFFGVGSDFMSGEEISLSLPTLSGNPFIRWTEHAKRLGVLSFASFSPWHLAGGWPTGSLGSGKFGQSGLELRPAQLKVQLKE